MADVLWFDAVKGVIRKFIDHSTYHAEVVEVASLNVVGGAVNDDVARASLAAINAETDKLVAKNGALVISDTNAHSSLSCYAIQAITATTISAITLASGFTGTITGIVIPAGAKIFIGFTAITLTSGACIAYNN